MWQLGSAEINCEGRLWKFSPKELQLQKAVSKNKTISLYIFNLTPVLPQGNCRCGVHTFLDFYIHKQTSKCGICFLKYLGRLRHIVSNLLFSLTYAPRSFKLDISIPLLHCTHKHTPQAQGGRHTVSDTHEREKLSVPAPLLDA